MSRPSLLASFFVVVLLLPTSAVGQSLRVATFNVNFGNRLGDQVLDAIAESKADIVCLQETTPQSEAFLRKHLAATYPEFHCVGHKGHYYAERFAFASRVKPQDIIFAPPEHGLFGSYSATFPCGEQAVRVINVHLSPFGIPRGSTFVEGMAAISGTESKHAREIAEILKKVDAEIPTIVAGDFNSLSTFHAPMALVEAGFIDSFASLHADPDKHHTWQWPTRPLPIKLRIDYVFHSNHFNTVDSAIIRRNGSDHFLVVSGLKLGEESDKPIQP
jgi:endonuclease/exonuclease/phosphatase (EEP) superfamily protein YafD